jgi:uncharacterized protein (DUF983 family)
MNAPEQTMATTLYRGAMCKCPNCGKGQLFRKFLKVVDECEVCGEELCHQRADDLPAYVVMLIVGHIVVGLMLWTETNFAPALWVHVALWFPLAVALSLGLLQPVKGMIVALQWQLGMHGFGNRRGLVHVAQERAS